MKRCLIIGVLIFSGLVARTQELEFVNKGAFEFSYANDVTGMTDQYYTNGVRLALTLPVFAHSPFNPKWLHKGNYSTSYHTLDFQYDVFTPDLKADLYTDRPFAATMMLGSRHQYVYHTSNLRLTSELKIGVMGQATGAGKLQNGLHDIMPGADPVEGWHTQMRNDLLLNYSFGVEKRFLLADFVEIVPGATLYLGLPYTKLEPGVVIRLGLFQNYFNYLDRQPDRKWQAYFLAGAYGSMVAYNATLQGGLFNPFNPYELDRINHLVTRCFAGVGVSFGKSTLMMTQTLITPEFPGAEAHSWGELRLIFGF